MTSAINPNNIDGQYPVAGQDNNSQGFRDNFTNIKTNFAFAANEITDLQSKVVLKAALSGTTLNNNMGGSVLSNAELRNMSETRIALGTTAGTLTMDYALGPYYTVITSGTVSLAFVNFPQAGRAGRMRLQIDVRSTAHRLVLPVGGDLVTQNFIGTENIQGYASGEIRFNKVGIYEFEFETNDAGANISIFDLNRNRDPMYLPSVESVAANGNISLTVTTSIVTVASNLVANLAAGAEGQIKVLAYGNVGVGNARISVTNAAWGGNGVANLSAQGSAATLQYIDSRWFCIGNNGVDFD